MTAKDAPAARRRPTSRDVAAAAGVSRSAVSFAFNDPTRVSTATRERILAAARELEYTPPPSGRTLRNGRTQSLGVLLPHDIPKVMENPYYARFLMGLGQVCTREGMSLQLIPPVGDSLVKAVRHAAVDGFVVCGLDTDRGEIAELTRRALPYVLVDSGAPEGAPSVDIDDREGARDVAQHLLELGHRRIAVLSVEPRADRPAPTYRDPLVRRIAGIEDALTAVGLSRGDITVAEVPCTRMDGYRATQAIMAARPRPTALVVLADLMAFGAIDALHDLGLDVPGDVSVTGFDDLPEAQWTRPRLTTVRQPIVAKGRIAGDFLISAIRGEDQHQHQVLQTVLITRESSKPPAEPATPDGRYQPVPART
ncbi:LacI family DNA-binding transcriptional regulator [Actinoplanes sp. NPDC049668]|uniref:LacI family DNA-binding transcriptional regulator n=1 Tax=unclassified Actinoplanes TaxID=2626549 RepID=UPI0033AF188F